MPSEVDRALARSTRDSSDDAEGGDAHQADDPVICRALRTAMLVTAFVAAACERPSEQPPSAPQSVELSIPNQPEFPGGPARPSVHPPAADITVCDDVLRAIKRCYEDSPALVDAYSKAWLEQSRDALAKGGAALEQLVTSCRQALASNDAC